MIEIYKITKDFPEEERYGITNQIRRAAASITANISEGFSRYYFKDKIRFYYQARASLAEVQNFILLAKDLFLIKKQTSKKLGLQTIEVAKLINGFIRANQNNLSSC